MITEDYVSFETAKLLKEKGFDELCPTFYEIDEPNSGPRYSEKLGWFLHNSYDYSDRHGKMIISAPTLQMVMKWLREVHKLGIFPTTYYREINKNVKHDYGSTIVMLDTYEIIGNNKNIEDYTFEAETYEETADKTIRYCLENLI